MDIKPVLQAAIPRGYNTKTRLRVHVDVPETPPRPQEGTANSSFAAYWARLQGKVRGGEKIKK